MSAGFLSALGSRVADALRAWAPGGPGAWCRRQRRHLRSTTAGSVIWIRDAASLPWAEWGGRRGYFAVGRMDGLTYLRALP